MSLRHTCLLVVILSLSLAIMGCPRKPPTAAFSADVRTGEGTLGVVFTDLSDDGTAPITTWEWDFGDGGGSSSQEPAHTYTQPGTYDVSLTVSNSIGSDTETKSEYIVVTVPGDTVVQENVMVIDDNPYVELDTVGQNQLTFRFSGTGALPIHTGDILTGSYGEGYLRRVTSVAAKGSILTVGTENASLTEVFEDAVIRTTARFTADDFAKVGIPLTKDGKARLILDARLYDSGGVTADLAGEIEFLPTVELDVDIDLSSITYFKLIGSGGLTIDADLNVDATQGSNASVEWSLFEDIVHTPKPKKTVATLWPSVWVTSELDILIGFSMEATSPVSLETGFDTTTIITIGAEYENAQWENLSGISLDANQHGPLWEIDAGFGARLYLKPQLSARVYSVTGPNMALIPYMAFNVEMLPPPPSADLGVGIDGELGFDLFKLTIFSWDFAIGYTHTWEGPYYPLWTWEPVGPTAAFSATPRSIDEGDSVSFTDQSTAGTSPITTRSWSFGDGGTSSELNPTHAYEDAGTYTVSLTVTTDIGSDTETKPGYITVSPVPPFTVLVPNGGESWEIGTTQTISWTINEPNSSQVKIQVFRGPVGDWGSATHITTYDWISPTATSYSWYIDPGLYSNGDDYWLNVARMTGIGEDWSDGNFSLL